MSLNLLQTAAKKGFDYGTIDPTGSSPFAGAIKVELPEPYSPPLGQVVKFHTSSGAADLFTWCE